MTEHDITFRKVQGIIGTCFQKYKFATSKKENKLQIISYETQLRS